MYRHLERRLAQRVLDCLQRTIPASSLPSVVVEQPPKVELGDFAIPIFPFAKPLRSAPLKIAEDIRSEIGAVEGIAEMQVAPPGYLNAKIDRAGWLPPLRPTRNRRPTFLPARFWSSIPASIPTRPRISDICAMPSSATRLSGCCALRVGKSTFRTTSTTPACRWPMWWSAFSHREEITCGNRAAHRAAPFRLLLLGSLRAGLAVVRGRDKQNLQVRLQTLHAIEARRK